MQISELDAGQRTHGLPAPGEAPREQSEAESLHLLLAELNARRMRPTTPERPPFFERDQRLATLEDGFLQQERALFVERARIAPSEPEAFLAWLEELEASGPGQHDPLFRWLADDADHDAMRWVLEQEHASEMDLEDLLALTQRHVSVPAKLELARAYWDAMGGGRAEDMRSAMLEAAARELGIAPAGRALVWEARALANLQMGLAYSRRYAHHAIGALAVAERTSPLRCALVARGLERLGTSDAAHRYYARRAAAGAERAERWSRGVLRPLVAAEPLLARWIAEGALMRLEAGRRCYERYKKDLALTL